MLALKIACTGMPFDEEAAWVLHYMLDEKPDWSGCSPPVALAAMGPPGIEALLGHLKRGRVG